MSDPKIVRVTLELNQRYKQMTDEMVGDSLYAVYASTAELVRRSIGLVHDLATSCSVKHDDWLLIRKKNGEEIRIPAEAVHLERGGVHRMTIELHPRVKERGDELIRLDFANSFTGVVRRGITLVHTLAANVERGDHFLVRRKDGSETIFVIPDFPVF